LPHGIFNPVHQASSSKICLFEIRAYLLIARCWRSNSHPCMNGKRFFSQIKYYVVFATSEVVAAMNRMRARISLHVTTNLIINENVDKDQIPRNRRSVISTLNRPHRADHSVENSPLIPRDFRSSYREQQQSRRLQTACLRPEKRRHSGSRITLLCAQQHIWKLVFNQ